MINPLGQGLNVGSPPQPLRRHGPAHLPHRCGTHGVRDPMGSSREGFEGEPVP